MTVLFDTNIENYIEDGLVTYASRYVAAPPADYISTDNIRVTTGANACKVNVDVSCAVTYVFAISENVNITAAGTTLTQYNMNRDSSTTLSTVVAHSPTFTGGTLIVPSRALIGGSNGSGSAAGLTTGLVLKPNTDYIYSVRLDGANDAYLGIDFYFREI